LLIEHWGASAELTSEQVARIHQLIAPTVSIRSCLRNQLADLNAVLLQLTTQQMLALDGMRRNRRTVVFGGAGTGKTVLAVERARHQLPQHPGDRPTSERPVWWRGPNARRRGPNAGLHHCLGGRGVS